VCAITGTNGKTTTTLLTYRMLSRDMPRVQFGGNIGIPLSRLVRQDAEHLLHGPVILEVSSFQLQFTTTFHPRIYAVLNVSVDHLDWHPSFDAYVQAKTFPLERMGRQDVVLLNHDDPRVRQMRESTNARVVYFSEKTELSSGLYINGTQLVAHLDKTYTIDTTHFSLTTFHSWQNVLCAVGIALILGVPTKRITRVLRTYHPLRHRQEVVAVINGIVFMDDSKATNLDAVRQLLGTIESGAILIMGGKDKGGDFSLLVPAMTGKIHHIIAIGQARQRIAQQLGGAVKTLTCETLSHAVQTAFHLAKPGDTVALSPGCSSFDQFRSYRHRGRVFRQLVLRLRADDEITKVL
jgi:UDP-N-acetylmuramoylalanine--D-glutamate ligase